MKSLPCLLFALAGFVSGMVCEFEMSAIPADVRTASSMWHLSSQLTEHARTRGEFPMTLQMFAQERKLDSRDLKDAWGRTFLYQVSEDENSAILESNGNPSISDMPNFTNVIRVVMQK